MSKCSLVCVLVCRVSIASISYEEEIPAFRSEVDAYRVFGGTGEWGKNGFSVLVKNRNGFYMDYTRYPGMKPFPGAGWIILEAESEGLGTATAELVLSEFPGGVSRKFFVPSTNTMQFCVNLDPSKYYQLRSIGIHNVQKKGNPWKIVFKSLRGIFKTSMASALRIEAKTGNPLHIVREGAREKPMIAIRNASQCRIAAHGVLNVKGFYGDTFNLPVDVALDGGQTVEIPVLGATSKGVWKIMGEIKASDGSVAKVDTRFAIMDFHEKKPKQPRGTFRLGVHWHLQRFTTKDRSIAASAMVACGAKLTRADMASMASVQGKGPDTWDFKRTDELMDVLESNGLAIDAIIFSVPKWAAKLDCQTSSDWRTWALGRPTPGTFERFCEGLSARYGTRIDYYEIGNEWDLNFFFRGTSKDAVEILQEAHSGLKRGCKACCISTCGWTIPSDTRDAIKNGRRGIQEYVLRNAKDYFDVHAIHCHGTFMSYADSIENEFFPLRERTNVKDRPWFSNETALTSLWNERNAALAVWKKILWAWANGSVDYIWYNLRGTGWNLKDAEQGYGLVTADFRPRDSYVAFASLATVVGGAVFNRAILSANGNYLYEFTKNNSIILTGWTENSKETEISISTDTTNVCHVDIMGNTNRMQKNSKKMVFHISSEPCAIVLKHPTFVNVDETCIRNIPSLDTAKIAIPSDSSGRRPDFIMERPEQVCDLFEGNPAEVKRLWKGPKDNSAKVWLSKGIQGLRVRVEVEDDVHSQPYGGGEQYMGDGIQILLSVPQKQGQWEFGFAHCDDGRTIVHCWIAPNGFDKKNFAAKICHKTSRHGKTTRYDVLIPYFEEWGFMKKTLDDGIRFNLMVNDNDGDGRDATIEIKPNTFHSKDVTLAPVVYFPL